jgi:hypothetical protein
MHLGPKCPIELLVFHLLLKCYYCALSCSAGQHKLSENLLDFAGQGGGYLTMCLPLA